MLATQTIQPCQHAKLALDVKVVWDVKVARDVKDVKAARAWLQATVVAAAVVNCSSITFQNDVADIATSLVWLYFTVMMALSTQE